MTYYLLTTWKKNGEKGSNIDWSISSNFDDLLHDMSLYTIKEDEMYVIDQFNHGNGKFRGAVVVASWYYDHNRNQMVEEDEDSFYKDLLMEQQEQM